MKGVVLPSLLYVRLVRCHVSCSFGDTLQHAAQRSHLATRTYPIVKRNIDSQAYIVKRIT